MPFTVKWRLQGETAQRLWPKRRFTGEDISITNPQGECFAIDYFALNTKTMDGDT
jgi:hypothetical protein